MRGGKKTKRGTWRKNHHGTKPVRGATNQDERRKRIEQQRKRQNDE